MSVANNLINSFPPFCFVFIGRWCRREWSSPPDSRANDPSRRVLYSSVFLGSPGKCEISFNIDYKHFSFPRCLYIIMIIIIIVIVIVSADILRSRLLEFIATC